MDLQTKLGILADAAKYDASCASSGTTRRDAKNGGIGSTTRVGICHSYTPDGRCVSLLKILLTNYCTYDCLYCINRKSSDVPRARFTPQEVIDLTLDFYRRNYIEGLFLSSGIIQNADYTMEQVIRVAKSLRVDHLFKGYIHLKTIPEATPELIQEAGRWADRISINVELPTQKELDTLAPEKNIDRIEKTMTKIKESILQSKAEKKIIKSTPLIAPGGQSTQMIIGATASPDNVILTKAQSLYQNQKLKRVYYSAYSPIQSTSSKLPPIAPPLVREHRLYQADWLLRFYGFTVDEITTEKEPNLDLRMDPKLAWALRHPERFPISLQTASRGELLRIPGIGSINVMRILQIRRWHFITFNDLKKLRISLAKVLPFIVTADHRPRGVGGIYWESLIPAPLQLDLFENSPGVHFQR